MPSKRVLEILAFLVPLCRFLEINLVGRLYLNEILLGVLLPWLLYTRGGLLRKFVPLTVVSLLGIWLVGQIGTDVIRQTDFIDFARGWSKIIFMALNFCAIYLIVYRSRRRIILFAIGSAVGGMFYYFFTTDPNVKAIPWQLGYGESVSWLILIAGVLFPYHGKWRWVIGTLSLLVASILNFYMGYRSLGGVLFLAACCLSYQGLEKRQMADGWLGIRKSLGIGVLTIVSAWASLSLYTYAAEHSWLGPTEQSRVQAQGNGKYGLLIGGRFEIIVSSIAIEKSPIIGYGSWAKDCDYARLYDKLKEEAGYSSGNWENCVIPSHSYLMGAWIETGIIGALTWLMLALIPLLSLLRVHISRDRLATLVLFASLWMFWNMLFSPFAGAARFTVPFLVIMMLAHLPNPKRISSKTQP